MNREHPGGRPAEAQRKASRSESGSSGVPNADSGAGICWNTMEVKCLRNRKRSPGWRTSPLQRNIPSGPGLLTLSPRFPTHRSTQPASRPHTLQGGGDRRERAVGSSTLCLWALFLLGVLHISSLLFSQQAIISRHCYFCLSTGSEARCPAQSLYCKPRGGFPHNQLPQSQVMFFFISASFHPEA